jgi:hypothetical protein
MNNAIKNLNDLAKEFDLSDFYSINIWGTVRELSLQGYFSDLNFDITKALKIELVLEGHFLRGNAETKFGLIKITLTN